MSFSVETFLTGLNLEQYVPNLKINGLTCLNEITDQVLIDVGIDKIGHRKRIIKELEKLNLIDSGKTVILTNENKDDEPPPVLPPKRVQKPQVPQPPVRTMSGRPVKPPRRIDSSVRPDSNVGHDSSIREGGSLPPGMKLNMDNYFVVPSVPPAAPSLPPVPARPDLTEEFTQIEEESKTKSSNEKHLSPKSPKRRAPQPPVPAIISTDTENGILIDIIDDPIPPPVSPPIPAPRRGKIKAISNDETCDVAKPQEVSHSEDDLSDGEEIFPDGDSDGGEEGKSLTISMKGDHATFQRLMHESTLNRTASQKQADRKSRFLSPGKNGYLHKKGGQKGTKPPQKRYVEFNGAELKYFKDKGCEPKQTIPVSRMMDVEIEPEAKKPTFHLITPNRKFTFFDNSGNRDEITIWVSILMEAILNKHDEGCTIGGDMADPDKEGWLSKQGHGVLHTDFKARYVVIKGDQLCYYYTFSDFEDQLPISKLQMALVSLKEDAPKKRLHLVTHTQRIYVFEADDLDSFSSWKRAINTAIQKGLSDCKYLKILQEVDSNKKCADCGDKNAVWASVNLMVIVCDNCIGCHRFLGPNISKARSILMDEKIWTDELIELFKVIGNANADQLWACKLPSDDQIQPDSPRNEREEFIIDKYKEKKYFRLSEHFGLPEELGKALQESVVTDNVVETLRLIQSGANVFYIQENCEDKKTPYDLAKEAGKKLQMELLSQYQGHLSIDEWEKLKEEEANKAELNNLPNLPENGVDYYEKSGLLMLRMHEKESWRDAKMFQLKGKRIEYKKSPKPEDVEVIDLTTIEDLKALDDHVTIYLQMPTKTYYLKSFTPEDCMSWYEAIKNKQVFGAPIEKQELGADKIPHLLDKCIKYIEGNALTETKTLTQEGIYRRNGSQTQIKRLIMLFNQDAEKVRLNIEEYFDTHVIAGLLKQYLRDLPHPILTQQLRTQFIANTDESLEHNERLYRYRDLIKGLPEVNYLCLRAVVLHLHLVTELADINKMGVENIMLIFGPIIVSCGNTLDQPSLNMEYKVVKEFLTYYEWLFDVSENEIKSQKAILDFIRTLNPTDDVAAAMNKPVMSSMQITIFVEDSEDQMKVDNTTKPLDVCLYFIKRHNLSPTTEWALFEISKDGHFERPVHGKESVYDLAIAVSNNAKLMVKENYLFERLAPHQSASFNSIGYLHYSTKGQRWQKNFFLEVKHGDVRIASKKDANKDEDKFGIHETQLLLYIGTPDPKKKPPGKYGFMLKLKESNHKDGNLRFFCSDNEYEVNMFTAAILNIRYPAGIWSNRFSKDLTPSENESKRNSQFWGRQSTLIHPEGTSNPLIDQLQSKRGTLRRLKNMIN